MFSLQSRGFLLVPSQTSCTHAVIFYTMTRLSAVDTKVQRGLSQMLQTSLFRLFWSRASFISRTLGLSLLLRCAALTISRESCLTWSEFSFVLLPHGSFFDCCCTSCFWWLHASSLFPSLAAFWSLFYVHVTLPVWGDFICTEAQSRSNLLRPKAGPVEPAEL